MKKLQRMFAVFLSVAMVLSLFPGMNGTRMVQAAETENASYSEEQDITDDSLEKNSVENDSQTEDEIAVDLPQKNALKTVTLTAGTSSENGNTNKGNVSYIDADGKSQVCTEYTMVSSVTTTMGESDKTSWYVVSGDITIEQRIECLGNVNLILMDDCELTASEGIEVNTTSNSLSIFAQVNGTGKLNAIGGDNAAIGSNVNYESVLEAPAGNIYIRGGIFNISAGRAAGIGGGYNRHGGYVEITGGKIKIKKEFGAKQTIGGRAIGGGSSYQEYPETTNGQCKIISGAFDVGNDVDNTIYGWSVDAASYSCVIKTSDTDYPYQVFKSKKIDGKDLIICNGEEGKDYTYNNHVLSILNDIAIGIYGTSSTDRIVISGDVTVNLYLRSVNIALNSGEESPLSVSTESKLNMWISGENTLTGKGGPGVLVPEGAELEILGTGKLSATGANGAGIGSKQETNSGSITIQNSTIIANGDKGAGIGAGLGGQNGPINITNSNVTANGKSDGAGIGGKSGNITIKSEESKYTINATGAVGGAGIGGSANDDSGTITINGGTIKATGAAGGAAIGGGKNGSASSIIFESSNVTADTGADGGAGIGGGSGGNSGTIQIDKSTVNATGVEGAGIGSGKDGKINGSIIIKNATVTGKSEKGAGIGGDFEGVSPSISITDSDITATGGTNSAGIGSDKAGNCNDITIECTEPKTITATGGEGGAGIGGGENGSLSGKITLKYCYTTAKGGAGAAGIGGGKNGKNNGTIEIYDGTVTATGGTDAAGIGGGTAGAGGTIHLEACKAAATGGKITGKEEYNAGIGAGQGGESGNVVIQGGSVKGTIDVTPTDGNGNNVYLYTATLNDTSNLEAIYEVNTSIEDETYKIGQKGDLVDNERKLYLYLPDKTALKSVRTAYTIFSAKEDAELTNTYGTAETVLVRGGVFNISGKSIQFSNASEGYITIKEASTDTYNNYSYSVQVLSDAEIYVTGSTKANANRISDSDALSSNPFHLILNGITIEHDKGSNGNPIRFAQTQNVEITLAEGTENILKDGFYPAMQFPNSCTIKGPGSLELSGGISTVDCPNLTISSGIIKDNGSSMYNGTNCFRGNGTFTVTGGTIWNKKGGNTSTDKYVEYDKAVIKDQLVIVKS